MNDRIAKAYIPDVHRDVIKLVTEGTVKLNFFDLADNNFGTEESAQRLKNALMNGLFEITGDIQAEPLGLSELGPETEVILRELGFDRIMSASSALLSIQEVIERQKRDHYTFHEISIILARVSLGSADYISEQQAKAFEEGRLIFFSNGSPVDPTTFKSPMGAYGFWDEYSTPEKINHWLKAWGAEYMFPRESEVPQEKPKQKGQMQQDAIINWLKIKGYNPKELPTNPPGKRGVKADCKIQLISKRRDLFTENTFDQAWKNLKREKRIINSQT